VEGSNNNGMMTMSGAGSLAAQNATANLFEIKKRSIDFFQHVSHFEMKRPFY